MVDKIVIRAYERSTLMIYNFNIKQLPKIENVYIVTRKTVWQVADPYHILLIVLEGECDIHIDGTTYRLRAGSCMLIPAEQSYKRTPINDTLCKMLYVHFTLADDIRELPHAEAISKVNHLHSDIETSLLNSRNLYMMSMNEVFLHSLTHTNNDAVSDICRKVEHLLLKYRIDDSLLIAVYLSEILGLLSRQTMKALRSEEADIEILRVPHNLKKAIWYINQNYTKTLSLDELCQHCSISASQLNRYFKSFFQTTCTQYIIELRVNRAKEMFLNSPELSVKSVSGAVGFDDPHYFSRIFTKTTGETPTDYKYRVTHFTPADAEND